MILGVSVIQRPLRKPKNTIMCAMNKMDFLSLPIFIFESRYGQGFHQIDDGLPFCFFHFCFHSNLGMTVIFQSTI